MSKDETLFRAELGRTIWSMAGGNLGGMKVEPPPKDGCIVTTTRSHASSTVNDAVTACNPTEVLRVGGAGHKVTKLRILHQNTYAISLGSIAT